MKNGLSMRVCWQDSKGGPWIPTEFVSSFFKPKELTHKVSRHSRCQGSAVLFCPHIWPLPSAQWEPHFLHLARPPQDPSPPAWGWGCPRERGTRALSSPRGAVLALAAAGPGRMSPQQPQALPAFQNARCSAPWSLTRQGCFLLHKVFLSGSPPPTSCHSPQVLCPMWPPPISRGPQTP